MFKQHKDKWSKIGTDFRNSDAKNVLQFTATWNYR